MKKNTINDDELTFKQWLIQNWKLANGKEQQKQFYRIPHRYEQWASPYWTRHTVHSIRTENYLRMCLCSSVSVYATIAFNMMIKRLALFNIVRKSNIISIPCYYSATLHSICQWVVSPNRTQWFNLCSAQFSRDIQHLTLPIWIWI